jgi:hypothetical protein
MSDALALVVDADRPEHERVAWLSRLRSVADPLTLARLTAVLNEPLEWLGRELVAFFAEPIRAGARFGVDARGLLALSPTPAAHLVADADGALACPALGAVVSIDDVGLLAPRLASPPPWLVSGRDGIAWLQVLAPTTSRALQVLRDGGPLEVTIGTDAGRCDVVITGAAAAHVTRRHARVVLRAGRVIALALDKDSPLFVDDKRVDTATVVRTGQRVSVAPDVPLLELASVLPVVERFTAGDEDGAADRYAGELERDPMDFGHVMHLAYGRRGLVSYAEPTALLLEPDVPGQVGRVGLDFEGRLYRVVHVPVG